MKKTNLKKLMDVGTDHMGMLILERRAHAFHTGHPVNISGSALTSYQCPLVQCFWSR